MPKTLFQKIWESHEVVPETPDTPAVLYVDLHLTHEVTSPHAFALLRERGLTVRRPDLTLATADHSTPTRTEQVFGGAPITVEGTANQIDELERNCAQFGIELFGLRHELRGIVHVRVEHVGRRKEDQLLRALTVASRNGDAVTGGGELIADMASDEPGAAEHTHRVDDHGVSPRLASRVRSRALMTPRRCLRDCSCCVKVCA